MLHTYIHTYIYLLLIVLVFYNGYWEWYPYGWILTHLSPPSLTLLLLPVSFQGLVEVFLAVLALPLAEEGDRVELQDGREEGQGPVQV